MKEGGRMGIDSREGVASISLFMERYKQPGS